MALGLTVCGLSSFEGNSPTIPESVAYDTIELYGDATFDKLWGRNEIVDSTEISNYDTETYTPEWTATTFVLAEFEDTLYMGNVSGLTAPLESWLVYRKDPDRTSLRFMKELDKDIITYKDYRAVLNNEYVYYIYAKTANELSNPIISDGIEPDYFGHFLIDLDNEVSYRFDTDGALSNMQTEMDYSEYGLNLEYNTYSVGQRKFKTGIVSAIVSDNNEIGDDELPQAIDTLEALEEFVTRSTDFKILKTRKGEMYKVFTHNYSQSLLNQSIPEQLYVSSFSFRESGDPYGNN